MERKLIILLLLLVFTSSYAQGQPTKEQLNETLLNTVFRGSAEEVKELIQKGADINVRNEFGSTPFKLAVAGNNYSVVELFLQLGQDPNKFSNEENPEVTPLIVAAANGRIALVQLFLKYGGKPDYRTADLGTALMSATRHTEIFKLLLAHGANIHARDIYGTTVLMKAALHGTEEVVTLLCKMGANPGTKDNRGNSAISLAESKGRKNIVDLLKNCSSKK